MLRKWGVEVGVGVGGGHQLKWYYSTNDCAEGSSYVCALICCQNRLYCEVEFRKASGKDLLLTEHLKREREEKKLLLVTSWFSGQHLLN